MEKGKKKLLFRDLNLGPCAWQVRMLTTTLEQYTNYNETLSITISEQIFEA